MSGTYITIKWYGSDTARSHLMHDNRTRSTIRDPHIERYGSITDEDLLARVVGRTKPITNRYLETMAYTQGTVQLEEVKSYLEQKLARPVVAYRHLDEAVEHCHFLAPNAGKDGRALRLNLSDFSEIKQRIAGILGRTVSPRGAGRPHLPLQLVKANPQVLQLVKSAYRTTVGWVQRLCHLYLEYGGISIAAIAETGSTVVQRIDVKRPVAEQLWYRRLKGLNSSGAGIYFAPILPALDEQRLFKTLFLDDVPIGQLSVLPPDAVIVQAGEHRYQVHIRVSEPVLAVEVSIAQRMLSGRFQTDRGSVDAGHYRQLPGFADWHYPEIPLVRIRDDIKPAGPAVSIDQLDAELGDQIAQQRKAASCLCRRATKCWLDFFERDRDFADRAYAAYLYTSGFTAAEMRLALLAESEDVFIRKRGYLGTYLDRMIRAMTARAPTGPQGTILTGINEGPHGGKPHPPNGSGGDHGRR